MQFWTVLAEELWMARTPFLVIAYLLTRALVNGSARVERYHLRAAGQDELAARSIGRRTSCGCIPARCIARWRG